MHQPVPFLKKYIINYNPESSLMEYIKIKDVTLTRLLQIIFPQEFFINIGAWCLKLGPGARSGRRTRFPSANDLIRIFPQEFFLVFTITNI